MQKEAPGADKIRPRTKSPSHKMRARQKETDQHVSHFLGWYDKSTLACFRWSVGIAKHDSGKLVCNLVLKPLTRFCSSNNFVLCTNPLHLADCRPGTGSLDISMLTVTFFSVDSWTLWHLLITSTLSLSRSHC